MRSVFFVASSLIVINASAMEHGVGISLIQQNQSFDISGRALDLSLQTPSFQYSLSSGPWSASVSINEGDTNDFDHRSDAPVRYALEYEQENRQLFIDYNFENAWLSTGWMSTEQSNRYWAADDQVRTAANSTLKVNSFIIESGYGWYFSSSQLLGTLGLTFQNIEDESNIVASPTNTLLGNQISEIDTSESAVLADSSLQYQYFISLNKKVDFLIGAGIQYSQSISGSAQISQTSQVRLAGNNLSPQNDESSVESDSESTSVSFQVGVVMDSGNLNFSANKLTSEKWSDALMELSIALYF